MATLIAISGDPCRLQVQVQLQVQQGIEAQDVHKGMQYVLQ